MRGVRRQVNVRAFAKLLTLFFGSSLILNDAHALFYFSEFVPDTAWVWLLGTVAVVAMLYVYASRMRLDATAELGAQFFEALIKLFGLYMFVEGLMQIASGIFTLIDLRREPWVAHHGEMRAIVFGFIHLLLAYIFAMRTDSVVRLLNLHRGA